MTTETKTQLTNNSQSVVNMTNGSASANFIDTTTGLILWSTQVSSDSLNKVLNNNQSSATLTLVEGLTVSYHPVSSGSYYVYLTGQIIDAGNTSNFKNKLIGNYAPADL